MITSSCIVILVLLGSSFSWAVEEAQIDAVVNACISSNSKDKICTAIVEFKQIGDDAIEAIKTYADLTREQYAALTVANMLIQGRLRVRTKSRLVKNANDIYDIRKDSALYWIEIRF